MEYSSHGDLVLSHCSCAVSAQPWGPQSWGSAPQNHPGVPTLLFTSPHLSLPQGHHQPLYAWSRPAATSTLLNQNLPLCCPFVGPHWGVLLSLPAQMGSPVSPACPALSCKQSRSDPGGLAVGWGSVLAPAAAPAAGQTLGCDSQPTLSSHHHTPNRSQLVQKELVWGSLALLQCRQSC